jgi:hypothetical protein
VWEKESKREKTLTTLMDLKVLKTGMIAHSTIRSHQRGNSSSCESDYAEYELYYAEYESDCDEYESDCAEYDSYCAGYMSQTVRDMTHTVQDI